jgi:hypothetical protein
VQVTALLHGTATIAAPSWLLVGFLDQQQWHAGGFSGSQEAWLPVVHMAIWGPSLDKMAIAMLIGPARGPGPHTSAPAVAAAYVPCEIFLVQCEKHPCGQYYDLMLSHNPCTGVWIQLLTQVHSQHCRFDRC